MRDDNDTLEQHAVEKGRGTLWLVWLIPLVALAMAGWMVYKNYAEKGVDILIVFDSGTGFEIGKTPLLYKGIKIGTVSDITIDPQDLGRIMVTVTVDRRAVNATAREGNEFVKVSPQVTLTEITGLDTILSGAYIEIYPADRHRETLLKRPERFIFRGHDKQSRKYFDEGRYVALDAAEGSLSVGTPVFYKKFVVGEVAEQKLLGDGVRYLVHIKQEYADLVKEESRFWKLSGIELKASLASIKVSVDSLASMLVGGIAFDSPSGGTPVTEQRIERRLYPSEEDVRLSDETIVLGAQEAYNLEANFSQVYYHGNAAGKVTEVTYMPESGETRIAVRLDRRFRPLANDKAHFWIVKPQISLEGVKGLAAVARGPFIAFTTGDKSAATRQRFTLHTRAEPPKGHRLTLQVGEGTGVREGTGIFFHDIEVGSVTEVRFKPGTQQLEADAVVLEKYLRYLNDSSLFYVRSGVEMEFSASGASFDSGSLRELVEGGIVMSTPEPGAKRGKTTYRLFKDRAAMRKYRYLGSGGMTLSLAVPEMGSLSEGDPVLYKQNKAGEIVSVTYDEAGDRFVLELFIAEPYSKRVNTSTRFTEASGIALELALPDVSIRTGSLETILRGGLAFETPDAQAAPLTEGSLLNLHRRDEAYVSFTLRMPRGADLKKGSPLRYRDVTVGEVKSLELAGEGVEAVVMIERAHADLLDAGSWFWLEPFAADLDGVRNPAAALMGPSIALRPGNSGRRADRFTLRETPPPATFGQPGLRIVLDGDRRSSLDAGSPLYYRQVPIGEVESWTLAEDGRTVAFVCYVAPSYAHLVRANAKFYNATAFGMDVSLFGVKLRTETLKTMVSGGIGMAVPDEPEAPVEEGARFRLENEPDEEWLEWSPSL